MSVLRFLLILLIAPTCLLVHDLLVVLWDHLVVISRHDMLGFGVHNHYTGWAFVILLPLCIFLSNMWWTDRRRYLPHLALLIVLLLWSMNVWDNHPNQTLLFVACCWATLPIRWTIERMTIAR